MSYYGEMRFVRDLKSGDVFSDRMSTYYQMVVSVEPDGDVVTVMSHAIRDCRTRSLWSVQKDQYQIDAKVQEIKEPWK